MICERASVALTRHQSWCHNTEFSHATACVSTISQGSTFETHCTLYKLFQNVKTCQHYHILSSSTITELGKCTYQSHHYSRRYKTPYVTIYVSWLMILLHDITDFTNVKCASLSHSSLFSKKPKHFVIQLLLKWFSLVPVFKIPYS